MRYLWMILFLFFILPVEAQESQPDPLATFDVPFSFQYFPRFNSDNSQLMLELTLSASAYLYDLENGELLRQLAPELGLSDLQWQNDDTIQGLTYIDREPYAVMIDSSTGEVIEQTPTPVLDDRRVQISLGRTLNLLPDSWDYELRDINGEILASFTANSQVRFSVDGTRIIAEHDNGDAEQILTIYDATTGDVIYEISGNWGTSVWNPDDTRFVMTPYIPYEEENFAEVALELRRQMREAVSGEVLYEWPYFRETADLEFPVSLPKEQFSPDGRYVMMYPFVHEVSTGEIVTPISAHLDETFQEPDRWNQFIWSQQSDALLTCVNGRVSVWEMDGSPPKVDQLGAECGVFSDDGRLVGTATRLGKAFVWERATGDLLLSVRHFAWNEAGAGSVASPVFSPDGTHLATWAVTDPPAFFVHIGAVVTTLTDEVILYEQPDENSPIIERLPTEAKLTILESDADPAPYYESWWYVTTEEGHDGWVFITVDFENETAPNYVQTEILPTQTTLWVWRIP